jgi:hypothetical protein
MSRRPPIRTEGSYALERVTSPRKEIAASLDVSEVAVHRFIVGDRRPNDERRKLILELYGIEPDAWDRVAAPPSTPEPAPAASDEDELGEDEDSDDPDALIRAIMRLARTRLRQIRREDANADLALQRLMNTAERGRRLLADRNNPAWIMRTPIWRELLSELAAGLEGHPEAAASVAKRFEALEVRYLGGPAAARKTG